MPNPLFPTQGSYGDQDPPYGSTVKLFLAGANLLPVTVSHIFRFTSSLRFAEGGAEVGLWQLVTAACSRTVPQMSQYRRNLL
jgi:hypothetical protein